MPFALSPRHREVVRALGEALFASDTGPTAPQLEALVLRVEDHLRPVSPPQRTMLLLALELVRWLPVLLLLGIGTFPEMGLAKRVALLERMDRSRSPLLLLPLIAFKTLLAMHFFEDERELRAMGYPGDERKRWLKIAA